MEHPPVPKFCPLPMAKAVPNLCVLLAPGVVGAKGWDSAQSQLCLAHTCNGWTMAWALSLQAQEFGLSTHTRGKIFLSEKNKTLLKAKSGERNCQSCMNLSWKNLPTLMATYSTVLRLFLILCLASPLLWQPASQTPLTSPVPPFPTTPWREELLEGRCFVLHLRSQLWDNCSGSSF